MIRPLVSVIVPHRDDLAALDRCLGALATQIAPGISFEIIVADNGSRCGMDVLQQLVQGRARLTAVAEPGAGPARNGGVAMAKGSILAFIDSDCIADPGWLAAGVQALSQGDIVGGAMRVLVDSGRLPTAAEAFELVFAFDNRAYVERQHFSVTANLFVRREDFDRVGGFRTGVPEDKDWCWRARATGLKLVYAPCAIVGHPARSDWAALEAKWARIMAEQYHLACESRHGRLKWWVRTWLLPLSIAPHALVVLMTDRIGGWLTRRRALAGLVRLRMWRFHKARRQRTAAPAKSSVDNRLL